MTTKTIALGQIVSTRGVVDHMTESKISQVVLNELITRHQKGDWGDIPEEDREVNEQAVTNGERVMSSYMLGDKKIWIITEWDRSVTTVLFPDEY